MLLRRIVFGAIALAALIFLLFRQPEPYVAEEQLVEQQFPAMGTWFTVSIWLEEGQTEEAAIGAIRATQRRLDEFAQHWRPFGTGALAQINATLDAGDAAEIPQDMRALFAQAEQWRHDTDGRFDVRIGALVSLWGFDAEERFRERPPEREDVARLVQALDRAPAYDGGSRFGPGQDLQLNFGGIAKGEAIRESSEALRDAGFDNHLINGGGDLIASGVRGERGWRVAVRHPRPGINRTLLAAIDLGDDAVFTSGDYERSFSYGGQRFHHVLDPATGRPADGMRSVTVVHPDPVVADAASTALFVAGDGWRELAARLDIDTVLVVDGDGRLDMTDTAEGRFRIIADLPRAER